MQRITDDLGHFFQRMPFRHAARHHFQAGWEREADVDPIAPAGVDGVFHLQQPLVVFTGEVNLADAIGFQQARLEQLIFEHRLLEELFLLRAFAVGKPIVVAVDVGGDLRIVVQHAVQIAGDIPVQVMAEDQLAGRVVHPRAVGGDHKGADFQAVADLRHVDVVAAGGEHEMHASLGQQLQRFFGVRRQGMVGRQQRAI